MTGAEAGPAVEPAAVDAGCGRPGAEQDDGVQRHRLAAPGRQRELRQPAVDQPAPGQVEPQRDRGVRPDVRRPAERHHFWQAGAGGSDRRDVVGDQPVPAALQGERGGGLAGAAGAGQRHPDRPDRHRRRVQRELAALRQHQCRDRAVESIRQEAGVAADGRLDGDLGPGLDREPRGAGHVQVGPAPVSDQPSLPGPEPGIQRGVLRRSADRPDPHPCAADLHREHRATLVA
jgi:hypothetical protein